MRRAASGGGSFTGFASASKAGDSSSPVTQTTSEVQKDWGAQ